MALGARIRHQRRATAAGPQFSPQQVEVLRWAARGKTSWEISMILRCTEDNVNYHLKQVFRKLEATNKSHAVSKAIRMGLITSG